MNRREWQHGLAFSLLFHILMLSAIWAAGVFYKNYREIPPFYTVRLFEVKTSPRPAARSGAKTIKKQVSPPSVPKKKKAVKHPHPAVKKRVQAVPRKKLMVSKTPVTPKKIKKKTKKKAVTPQKNRPENLLKKRLEKIREQVREKQEEQFLKKRLNAISSMIKKREEREEASKRQGETGRDNRGQEETLRAYCAAIWETVREHWNFPEYLMDQPGLTCIIVIRIQHDGTVEKIWFEKKSGDDLFDRSAMRAVKEASPFPKIPKALGPDTLEIGIRFRPGQVGE